MKKLFQMILILLSFKKYLREVSIVVVTIKVIAHVLLKGKLVSVDSLVFKALADSLGFKELMVFWGKVEFMAIKEFWPFMQ